MQRPLRVFTWGLILVGAFAGCVNLNVYVYFDQKKLNDAADKFVLEVRKDVLSDDAAKIKVPAGQPNPTEGSWLERRDLERAFCSLMDALARSAYADSQDDKYVNTDTPAIRKIKERMKERMKKLLRFYNDLNVGESNQATLEIRSQDGLSAKDKSDLRSQVKEENGDRDELFREVASANKAAESEIAKIRTAWAKAFRERTNKGWWIQKDNGDWIHKGDEDR